MEWAVQWGLLESDLAAQEKVVRRERKEKAGAEKKPTQAPPSGWEGWDEVGPAGMGDIQTFHPQQGARGASVRPSRRAEGRASAGRKGLNVATPVLPVPRPRVHQLFSLEP